QQASDYRGRGYCLMHRFELLRHDRAGKAGDARNVAARSRQACDEATAERIVGYCKDNRDVWRSLLDNCDSRATGHDHIDFLTNELDCDFGGAVRLSLIPTILNGDGATLDPAEFT